MISAAAALPFAAIISTIHETAGRLTAVFAISDEILNIILREAKAHSLYRTVARWTSMILVPSVPGANHDILPAPC